MSSEPLVALRDVSFAYDNSPNLLIRGLSVHLPAGFTGVVGANGSGKTTLLKLLAQDLVPVSGTIVGVRGAVYCEQRTDVPPDGLAELLQTWDGEAVALRGKLDVADDAIERWETLSHGERKRSQIAAALWQQPYLLAVDEPTNHIDAVAQDLLVEALRAFRGVGAVVSHDRDLLDELCVQCIWLEPPNARLFSWRLHTGPGTKAAVSGIRRARTQEGCA